MAFPMFSIILFLCVVAQQDYMCHAFDAQFKIDIMQQFNKLDSKLNTMDSDLKHELGHIKRTVNSINDRLILVEGNVQSIEGDIAAINQRSSQSHTATHDVKSMTEKIYVDVHDISVDIKKMSNYTTGLILNVSENTETLKESIAVINGTTSCLEGLITEVVLVGNTTIELLQNVTENTEALTDPLREISSNTVSLENQLIQLILLSNTTIDLLLNVSEDTEILTEYHEELLFTSLTQDEHITNLIKTSSNATRILLQGIEAQIIGRINPNITELSRKLTTILENINTTKQDISTQLAVIEQGHIPNNSEIARTLTIITGNINTNNQNISQKMKEIESIARRDCPPDGFIVSGQCFILFKDKQRTWTDAQSKCRDEGLHLAEPRDAAAVPLRNYLLDTYGDFKWGVWLGARADGSKVMWQRSQRELRTDNALWWPGHPTSDGRLAFNHCLVLLVDDGKQASNPNQPYWSFNSCSNYNAIYTLCEAAI